MEKNQLKKQISIGVILIVIGIMFFVSDYVALKREEVFSAVNLELTELLANNEVVTENVVSDTGNEEKVEESVTSTPIEPEVSKKEEVKVYETYAGILEIAKINFSKGFYKKDSSLNNVKYNLKILAQSSYPDEERGNVIIIGHSGDYNNSYFRNLYKLELEDTAILKYNNKTYTYKIVNIYTDTKDGTVTIYRDDTKSCLTLITCTKDDNTTQTIYILELVSVK